MVFQVTQLTGLAICSGSFQQELSEQKIFPPSLWNLTPHCKEIIIMNLEDLQGLKLVIPAELLTDRSHTWDCPGPFQKVIEGSMVII